MSIGDDERITLDRGTFKALASETRVDILKHLDGTQKTVSELAREMNMNKATMYQHLEQLREVGLVKRLDGDERMTTVKPDDPLEAPEAGPPRKWVYYRLTWKGKNVVNPGKVKFAVMLAVVGIISIAVIAILVANVALAPSSQGPGAVDSIAPEITMWSTPDANTETTSYTFSVEVREAPLGRVISGLKEENVTLYYGWGDKEESGPNVVPWTAVTPTVTGDKFTGKLGDIDWAHKGGKFLYLKVTAWDRAGNSNSSQRVVFVSALKEEDLGWGDGLARIEGGGGNSGAIGITVNIRNFGDSASETTTVGVYSINPDPDGDGIINAELGLEEYTITTIVVGPIEPNKEENVTKQITDTVVKNVKVPPSGNGRVYFAIDPANKLKEESKKNNVMSIQPPEEFGKILGLNNNSKKPSSKQGAGLAPGFEIVGLVAAMAVAVVFKSFRSAKDQ